MVPDAVYLGITIGILIRRSLMLTGQAKKDYQRGYMKDYMRRRRGEDTVKTSLRPTVKTQPSNLAPDGYPIQHEKSMMVGYVPKEAV